MTSFFNKSLTFRVYVHSELSVEFPGMESEICLIVQKLGIRGHLARASPLFQLLEKDNHGFRSPQRGKAKAGF